MTARVLVTRSQPGADETAERLRAMGCDPVVEPLFTLQPLDAPWPDFDALAFTSANGVRAFAARNARRNVPVWCVGGRTAEEALTQGFPQVASADGDVAALIERIRQDASPSLRLLHVGNEAARGDLVGALRASGFEAMFVAAFRAQPVHTPGPLLADQLAGRSYLDAILLHSPRAGAILAGFAAGAKSRAPLRMAAISHAAAEDVRAFADRLEIAQAPNEDALLAALQRMLAEG